MTSVKANIQTSKAPSIWRKLIILVSTVLLLSFGTLSAQQIKLPERPNPPRLVNDYAGVLSPDDKAALESKLVTYTRTTSTRIVVVIIPTLDGAERAQYATELIHEWGIGDKDKDNGVLLLISKDDRKMFLATGRGVEEFLPDAITKRITELTIKPKFKNGDYAGGIDAGIEEIQAHLNGQFKGDYRGEKPEFNLWWVIAIIIGIIILASIFGGGNNNGRTYSSSGSSIPWFLLGALTSGGGGGGGGSRGGGDSGGFGGFGGGDSGGGGAGSDW